MIDSRLGRKIRGKWKPELQHSKCGNVNTVKHSAYRNLALIDMRTIEGKELLHLASTTVQDKGGAENLSTLELNLIEAYAITVWRRRRLGAAIVNCVSAGKSIPRNLDNDFRRYVRTELELGQQLGFKRTPKMLPTPQEYAKKYGEITTT